MIYYTGKGHRAQTTYKLVVAKKHFFDVQHQLLLARIQACNFSLCLPSSTLLESTYKSLAEPR